MTDGKLKILIVEDEIISALFLTKYFNLLGHECCGFVTKGRDAVTQAEKENPDIIFMDIKLADDIDGVEAARRILSKRKVGIVFMSAYSDDEIIAPAKNLNPLAYFLKPLDTEAIREVIEGFLDLQKDNVA
ncbi:MAG: hypothetical protein A2008_02430 [Candidatus Wallbacteria bacterium GWC2_49_35]|uniref:Response regulatory domain-containing protein n=1 Tax=Candidatus Wallbacteria bacterium GWC2_49_35 TaxID=1817813 RepID=A0A1F7WT58_9BACT|nr:MAG: hypothetical protein A2008_02430 [Candidatus Wallbacteria bacterium GWC2_49_35]HBC74235.1 hypothetical protein [Candidatus Wallbacteria bacterium]